VLVFLEPKREFCPCEARGAVTRVSVRICPMANNIPHMSPKFLTLGHKLLSKLLKLLGR